MQGSFCCKRGWGEERSKKRDETGTLKCATGFFIIPWRLNLWLRCLVLFPSRYLTIVEKDNLKNPMMLLSSASKNPSLTPQCTAPQFQLKILDLLRFLNSSTILKPTRLYIHIIYIWVYRNYFYYCVNINFVPKSGVLFLHSHRDRTAGSGTLFRLWLYMKYGWERQAISKYFYLIISTILKF